MLIISLYFHE
jgi:hypothetical protein